MTSTSGSSRLAGILKKYEAEILPEWIQYQLDSGSIRRGLIKESELREQSREFLSAFAEALQLGATEDIFSSHWSGVRDVLTTVSRARARQGFTPAETATFLFTLKLPIFSRLRTEIGEDAAALGDETWNATQIIDRLGLLTTEIYQKGREEVISRQQQELLELSTPVVSLWEGVLALPLIGTLDSARTQVVMESLLNAIVETGAGIAIIDITGVPTVDTLVAQHLLKTVAAARLMGADCILSGIRPQIAQTIVHLGVDLGDVITKATLADAFALAMQRNGKTVVNVNGRP